MQVPFVALALVDELQRQASRRLHLRGCELLVVHPQADVTQGARITWSLGLEQRELALLRVRAHQGELVGALDDMHPRVLADEIGDGVALVGPERHVVEWATFHGGEIVHYLRGSTLLP